MQKNIANRDQFPSRRRFLAGCSVLTLSAAVPGSVLALPSVQRKNTLDPAGFAQFAMHVGSNFRVYRDGFRTGDLVLVEAQPLPAARPDAADARNERFSLMFEGALAGALTQDTYLFEHPAFGRFLMFIVPVFSPRSPRAYYQAIFNRPFAARSLRER